MQDYPNRAAAWSARACRPNRPSRPSHDAYGDPPLLPPTRRWRARSPRPSTPATPRRSALLLEHPALARARSATRSAGSHDAASRRHRLARTLPRGRPPRSGRWSPPGPTSTRASPARTARRRCTGRPAATTSTRSTRCWTPAPTSKPAAPSSAAAHRSPTPSPSASGTPRGGCWNAAHGPTSGRRPRSASLDRVHDALAQTRSRPAGARQRTVVRRSRRPTRDGRAAAHRGADPAWVGHDNLTAAQAAERSDAHELAAWLRGQDRKP